MPPDFATTLILTSLAGKCEDRVHFSLSRRHLDRETADAVNEAGDRVRILVVEPLVRLRLAPVGPARGLVPGAVGADHDCLHRAEEGWVARQKPLEGLPRHPVEQGQQPLGRLLYLPAASSVGGARS